MAGGRFCGSIVIGRHCQGTIFRSKQNVLRIKCSMNKVPSSMLTDEYGAIPNDTRVCKLPRWRCSRMEPSSLNDCLVPVRRKRWLFSFIWFAHSYEISSDRFWFLSAPMSRRHTEVCITAQQLHQVAVILYDNQSLYVALNIWQVLIDVGASFKSLTFSATFYLGVVVGDWLTS